MTIIAPSHSSAIIALSITLPRVRGIDQYVIIYFFEGIQHRFKMTASQQFCRIWRNRSEANIILRFFTLVEQITSIRGACLKDSESVLLQNFSLLFFPPVQIFSYPHRSGSLSFQLLPWKLCQIHGHTAFSFIWRTACYCDHFFIFSTKLEIGTERLVGFCSAVVHLLHFNFYISTAFYLLLCFFRTFFSSFIRL